MRLQCPCDHCQKPFIMDFSAYDRPEAKLKMGRKTKYICKHCLNPKIISANDLKANPSLGLNIAVLLVGLILIAFSFSEKGLNAEFEGSLYQLMAISVPLAIALGTWIREYYRVKHFNESWVKQT